MKRWDMIHKIKSLYENGQGSSIRSIARELKISRNTVRKFIRMDEREICNKMENRERFKKLDEYRPWLVHLLEKHPKLSAVKIMRKFKEKGIEIDVSDRTLRRYASRLKETVAERQVRYYEPVLDMAPGGQCQTDPGELRNVSVGGTLMTIYFVVFVLSYSRLMYVAASRRPVNTDIFIRMHDEAFRYFDGIPDECIYDQTKLVALREEYREVQYNERFYQYATTAHFDARVCAGYDPESKGKVEAGVKYVKQDFFYGDKFDSMEDLLFRLADWQNNVANVRKHGTTGLVPREVYDSDERSKMKPYIFAVPASQADLAGDARNADKTGLISYKSNKYSVPMPYQRARVLVREESGRLIISQTETGDQIAEHPLETNCKGKIFKNTNHYRDFKKTIEDHEDAVRTCINDELSDRICTTLKRTSPKIYKDQLAGLKKVLKSCQDLENLEEMLERIADRTFLTVTFIRDYLTAALLNKPDANESFERKKQRGAQAELMKYAQLTPESIVAEEVSNHAVL